MPRGTFKHDTLPSTPENMDFLKACLNGEDIAAKLHVAAHGVTIDVRGETFWNLDPSFLGELSCEIGKAFMLTRIVFKCGACVYG